MRVAVVVAWRPKGFPDWKGRDHPQAGRVPLGLRYDRGAAPYAGIHLAALMPRRWDVQVVHEMVRDGDQVDADAVFLSTMDFAAPRARHLARQYRTRGVKVIVGGLYPTLNPGYFRGAADAVVVGEAEPVWPRLVADLERNRLEPIYVAERPADLSDLPVPRFDLVEPDFTNRAVYEATRGCPFTCSFCVLSKIRLPYRRRPIPHVVRDVQAVPSTWRWPGRRYITFWDNNLGADRHYFRDLCEAMTPLRRYWGTESSIDTITPESTRMMGRAGCRFLYIGLESLNQASVGAVNKRHNQVSEYKRRIRLLHDHGIMVMSIFLVGLDGDTAGYIRELPNLVHDIGVDVPVFSLASPIEGTPFHQGLRDSGRLLDGDILGGMDGVQLLYQPEGLSPDELELALFECMRRGYSTARVITRLWRGFRSSFWGGLIAGGANLHYIPHQRDLSRTGRARIAARGSWPGPGRTLTQPQFSLVATP